MRAALPPRREGLQQPSKTQQYSAYYTPETGKIQQGMLRSGPAEEEHSPEWTQYLSTGRTGRVDTAEVKACIAEL